MPTLTPLTVEWRLWASISPVDSGRLRALGVSRGVLPRGVVEVDESATFSNDESSHSASSYPPAAG